MARRAAPALYELMRRPGAPVASSSSPAMAGTPRRVGNAPGLPSTFEISLRRAIVLGIAVVVAVSIAYGLYSIRHNERALRDIIDSAATVTVLRKDLTGKHRCQCFLFFPHTQIHSTQTRVQTLFGNKFYPNSFFRH